MTAQSKEPQVVDAGKEKDEKQDSASTKSSGEGSASGSADSKQVEEGEKPRQADGPLLLKRGAAGVVDFFNYRNGYGFIQVDDDGERVFVHCNSVLTFVPNFSAQLQPGDKVEFDIIHSVKGKEAVAVTGIGGYRIGTRRFFNNSRPSGPRRRDGGGSVVVRTRRPRDERQPQAEEEKESQVADKMKELSVAGEEEGKKEDKPKPPSDAKKETGKRQKRPKKTTMKVDDSAGNATEKEKGSKDK